MKVVVLVVLGLFCQLSNARPLIADVLRAANMNFGGNGGMKVDPSYEMPQYQFQYEVKDPESGNDFGHRESRMDGMARGYFHTMLPDGRRQRVEYVADQGGFRPVISYEGEPVFGAGVGLRMGEGAGQAFPFDVRGQF